MGDIANLRGGLKAWYPFHSVWTDPVNPQVPSWGGNTSRHPILTGR